MLISDSKALAAFCGRQAGADFITVDTEFMRDRTYWPVLCLVQVAGPEEAVAIDALAPELDLAPLLALMADPAVTKVFHAARQDIEIFYHMSGKVPSPLVDTQVAAMVCGFGDSVSYETLAGRLAGASIDKSSRFTDWAHRPLTERQLKYALEDVTHLRAVYEKLAQRLARTGRTDWVREEMTTLTDPHAYRLEPREAWRRLKVRSEKPRFLAVLRELAAWREEEAQKRDLPRGRVIKDESLVEIAAHAPASVEDLARTRGLGRSVADGRQGAAILAAIARALALPDSEWPHPRGRSELPANIGPVVELLRVLLKAKCEQHGVAQKLVANAADLELIAAGADGDAAVPALNGWRRELFGADALALKNGTLALAVADHRIALVALAADARRAAG
jgi:ribonuclease D